MKAKDLDKQFDAGKDISEFLDLSRAKRVNEQTKRVNVDFPAWMIHSLDKEASRLGVTASSLAFIGGFAFAGLQGRRQRKGGQRETDD